MNISKDRMVITEPCGCTVGVGSGNLDYCRLHKAAPLMLAACKAALSVLPDAHAALTADLVGGHGKGRCRGGCPDLEAIALLEVAIRAAEPKP